MSRLELANGRVALGLGRSGVIESLRDLRTGREYVADPDHATLFRLSLPLRERIGPHFVDPDGHGFAAEDQPPPECSVWSVGGDRVVRLKYGRLVSQVGSFPIAVSVEIRLAAGDDAIRFRCRVRNETDRWIPNLMVPLLAGCRAGRDDLLVTAARIFRLGDLLPWNESSNWEESPYVAPPDALVWGPYGLGMPWASLAGPSDGLYLASHDRTGTRHALVIQDLSGGARPAESTGAGPFALGWEILCDVGPSETWASPELVLAPYVGDWHVAADRYRAQLRTWYRVARRPGFADTVASFNTVLTQRRFEQIAELARDIARFGVRDLIVWNFGTYYPNAAEPDDFSSPTPRLGQFSDQFGGPDALREAVAAAQAVGVRVGCIFSQRLWNTATLRPADRATADAWVIRRLGGAAALEAWRHRHYSSCQWGADASPELYVMCPGVGAWQERAIETFATVVERAGYTTLFCDQAIEDQVCWNREHGSDASHSVRASPGFLARLRARLTRFDPERRLIAEGFEVRASQEVDLLWCWTDRLQPGARQSHPEVWRYTLPEVPIALPLADDRATANRWFAQGVHLAIVPRSLESGLRLSDLPVFADHVRGLVELRSASGDELAIDRYVDTVGIAARDAIATGYTGPDRLVLVVANVRPERVRARVSIDPVRHPVERSPSVVRSSLGRPGRVAAASGRAAAELDVWLEGFEVVVIGLPLRAGGIVRRAPPERPAPTRLDRVGGPR